VHPDYVEAVKSRIKDVTGNEKPVPMLEEKFLRLDGSTVDVEVSAIPFLYNNKNAVQVVARDISSRKMIETALLESEEKYRTLVESSDFSISLVDQDGHLFFMNRAALKMTKMDVLEIPGKTLWNIFPKDIADRYLKEIRFAISEKKQLRIEGSSMIDNKHLWFDTTIQPMKSLGGELERALIIAVDISERKKAEELLKNSLREKELLLKEVHHRVKNNLQIVTSILGLQSLKAKKEEVKKEFDAAINRIRSMSLVHEKLHQSGGIADIDFSKYITSLTKEIHSQFEKSRKKIELRFDTEPVLLSLDQAIPCGLIINELLTNAFKYAFPAELKGKRIITVSLFEKKKNIIELGVADNGAGIKKNANLTGDRSLGMKLIEALINQLGGSSILDRKKGTKFLIEFHKI
jgi:PAS domain S-box-containing protein